MTAARTGRCSARRVRVSVLLALGLLAPSGSSLAEPEASGLELKVKAAFLYNFAKFVTWPAAKFETAQSPIELCVFADDPIGGVLDKIAAGKLVESRPLSVRHAGSRDDLGRCHILYLDDLPRDRADAVLQAVSSHAVLTVHAEATTLHGAVIRFYLDDRKVRFEINESAAQREGLQLSSRLLSVARIVSQ